MPALRQGDAQRIPEGFEVRSLNNKNHLCALSATQAAPENQYHVQKRLEVSSCPFVQSEGQLNQIEVNVVGHKADRPAVHPTDEVFLAGIKEVHTIKHKIAHTNKNK